MFATFETAQLGHCQTTPKFNGTAVEGLPREGFDKAQKEISAWDAYEATPLLSLSGLAERLKLGDIRYKHEASRFGLGSFKALGGAYAVLHVLQRELSKALGVPVALEDVRNGKHAALVKELTVISATDGNHGRSVAWGASRFGANCRIYIHAEVSEHRAEVMRGLGAEVIRIEGDYDDTVARTRLDAEEHGWLIVSDTSWPGYRLPPLDVMAGYGVMAQEIVNQYTSPPTHVFLQGGVGGLAAAVAAVFCQVWGTAAPGSSSWSRNLRLACLRAQKRVHRRPSRSMKKRSWRDCPAGNLRSWLGPFLRIVPAILLRSPNRPWRQRYGCWPRARPETCHSKQEKAVWRALPA